jgi:hypothetical protein
MLEDVSEDLDCAGVVGHVGLLYLVGLTFSFYQEEPPVARVHGPAGRIDLQPDVAALPNFVLLSFIILYNTTEF